jgi:hypothetical protein
MEIIDAQSIVSDIEDVAIPGRQEEIEPGGEMPDLLICNDTYPGG